jgi:hypothetical protein
MMIHAPSSAFVVATMQSTTNVATAPMPLMSAPERQPGSRRRRQCSTMPVCDSVKEMKTPIM